MRRRGELRSVLDGLFESFLSRNNDLNGYWALGQIKAFMQDTGCLQMDVDLLTGEAGRTTPFQLTFDYYCYALQRHLDSRAIPRDWVSMAELHVKWAKDGLLGCRMMLRSDLGHVYRRDEKILVWRHDPQKEGRRSGEWGPSNQKGH